MDTKAIAARSYPLWQPVNLGEPTEAEDDFSSPTRTMPIVGYSRWGLSTGTQVLIEQNTQYRNTQLDSSVVASFSAEIIRNLSEFKEEFKVLCGRHCGIVQTKIYDLPSDEFKLITPIDAILKIYTDEVIALIPELELYSDGTNEMESLNALKLELLDLIEDLESMGDEELGEKPKAWKRILKMLVKKCQ